MAYRLDPLGDTLFKPITRNPIISILGVAVTMIQHKHHYNESFDLTVATTSDDCVHVYVTCTACTLYNNK